MTHAEMKLEDIVPGEDWPLFWDDERVGGVYDWDTGVRLCELINEGDKQARREIEYLRRENERLRVDNEKIKRPEIVCLCGSTKFKEQYRAENKRLTLEGYIVLSVGFFGHADGWDIPKEDKRRLDELHLRKIDLADRVHVINVDGYIGESTRREIAYGREQGKAITWLEEDA